MYGERMCAFIDEGALDIVAVVYGSDGNEQDELQAPNLRCPTLSKLLIRLTKIRIL